MSSGSPPVRVLYSFPHKIGAGRICDTAWYQVAGASDAGVAVALHTGVVHKALPQAVEVRTTLGRGRARIPYRALGRYAFDLHDAIVARRLQALGDRIDVVHTWPLGARRTLELASALGIPTVLERPNTHTRYAYEVVRRECERLGVPLPPDHEHAYNEELLRHEEIEYRLADYLLCPSDFVVKTFLENGFAATKLVRHTYGFDPTMFRAADSPPDPTRGLRALFVGVAAVRKGLHFALDAWLKSRASGRGSFRIAGEILPAYGEKLASMLADPSIEVLGHRTDIPQLMRESDVLILPSIEEGSALACSEAIGSGCVPLVSSAASGVCWHMENALVHDVGDVDRLEAHITAIDRDRGLLAALRKRGLESVPQLTWSAAGVRLSEIYGEVSATAVMGRRKRAAV